MSFILRLLKYSDERYNSTSHFENYVRTLLKNLSKFPDFNENEEELKLLNMTRVLADDSNREGKHFLARFLKII